MSRVDRLLSQARRRLVRLEPAEAAAAVRRGALLVDTRPEAQRRRDGAVPGAVVIDRTVLEWRLDPTSPDRIPEASDPERTVIVLCDEGYSSSLAAATLQRLGLRNATDVAGGFQAWASCGMAVERLDPDPAAMPPAPPPMDEAGCEE